MNPLALISDQDIKCLSFDYNIKSFEKEMLLSMNVLVGLHNLFNVYMIGYERFSPTSWVLFWFVVEIFSQQFVSVLR
jgi:hypothetical protein